MVREQMGGGKNKRSRKKLLDISKTISNARCNPTRQAGGWVSVTALKWASITW
jgi:hypothetical protein